MSLIMVVVYVRDIKVEVVEMLVPCSEREQIGGYVARVVV